MPKQDALDLTGLTIADETMTKLYTLSQEEWRNECDSIKTYFDSLGERTPKALYEELEALRYRLRRLAGK